jgi:hypothetical protein
MNRNVDGLEGQRGEKEAGVVCGGLDVRYLESQHRVFFSP